MKPKILLYSSYCFLLTVLCFDLSAQSIESMKLKFIMPSGFIKDQTGEFDKGAALGGPYMRLISENRDALIAITILEHDTTSRGEENLQFIRDHFNPKHQRNQNWYSYVRMLADSLNFPITKMTENELKFYNADYGAMFTIKDAKNPYLKEFPTGKGTTMFKWKRGDVFVFYFFKREVEVKDQERIMEGTKSVMVY